MSAAAPERDEPPSVCDAATDGLELRRELVRRAGFLRVRARILRGRRSLRAAVQLDQRAQRLLALSRRID